MSQYKTGTASVTNGSATVTGTNTLWLANVTSGDSFTIASTGVMYDVASVDSDTQVTLSVAYAGTTASGVVYAIGTGFTVPDSFPEMSQGDIETATIFTRGMRKIQSKFSGLVSDISDKAAIAGQTFTGDIAAPGVTATGSFNSPGIDDNAISTAITIDSSENVGIGSDDPVSLLEIRSVQGSTAIVTITGGNNQVSAVGEVNSQINFAQSDGSIGTTNNVSGIVKSVSEIYNGARAGLAFHTAGSGVISEKVRIDYGGNVGIGTTTPAEKLSVNGTVAPTTDNSRTLGTASLRWSEVFAGTGTINASDAREKTDVRQFNASEITAAKTISKEIGVYRWLQSVAEKGDGARLHVGFTVQRAMEIMIANDLDPMAYGFICYDEWNDIFVEHAEVLAVKAVEESEGSEAVEAVEAREAWTEKTREAGDRYAFRYDQLNLFIARGIEARLSDLEDNA